MNFKHYILTRFNLGVYSENNPYADTVGNPSVWMKHRTELFERYCLPSVLGQTNMNFTWIMAFDENTPYEYTRRYDYIENVKIVYEQPHIWLRREHRQAEWLITSRFDNDDIYSPEFVNMIQSAFDEKTEILDIDYRILHLKTKQLYHHKRRRCNSPFLSLSERWFPNICTAFGHPHTYMPDFYTGRRLDGILAYQVIHDKNVINKIPKT